MGDMQELVKEEPFTDLIKELRTTILKPVAGITVVEWWLQMM
jgi:hypothetical protein